MYRILMLALKAFEVIAKGLLVAVDKAHVAVDKIDNKAYAVKSAQVESALASDERMLAVAERNLDAAKLKYEDEHQALFAAHPFVSPTPL